MDQVGRAAAVSAANAAKHTGGGAPACVAARARPAPLSGDAQRPRRRTRRAGRGAAAAMIEVPLYGGGFVAAFVQLAAFYYSLGLLLHCVVPRVFAVQGIQKEPRGAGEPLRDAIASIGEARAPALMFNLRGGWARRLRRWRARGGAPPQFACVTPAPVGPR